MPVLGGSIRIDAQFDEDEEHWYFLVDNKKYGSKTEAIEAIVSRACALLEVDN